MFFEHINLHLKGAVASRIFIRKGNSPRISENTSLLVQGIPRAFHTFPKSSYFMALQASAPTASLSLAISLALFQSFLSHIAAISDIQNTFRFMARIIKPHGCLRIIFQILIKAP